jgi:dUTP pyrophosphatase
MDVSSILTNTKRVINIKLDNGAQLLTRRDGDVGFDLKAIGYKRGDFEKILGDETLILYPSETILIKTGVSLELPKNIFAMVCPRSGLALKHGITVLNSPGIVDPNYIGEIGVILHNTSDKIFKIRRGMRIAQLIFQMNLTNIAFDVVYELSETNRGTDGFGSSGR